MRSDSRHPRPTVCLATDSAVTRDAIRLEIERRGTLQVVAEAEDWDELQSILRQQTPNILMLSGTLPGMSAIHDLIPFLETAPEMRLVGRFRSEAPPDRLADFMALRPRAVISTRLDASDLVHTMELVWQDLVIHPVGHHEQDESAPQSLGRLDLPDGGRLSAQELALLRMLAQGSTDNEIAASLGIGRRTVHSYLERIRGKLGANNRVHAVALAASAGLVYAQSRNHAEPLTDS